MQDTALPTEAPARGDRASAPPPFGARPGLAALMAAGEACDAAQADPPLEALIDALDRREAGRWE